ncbi:MAG: transposase [Candidatus Omnitrophica bacterium]|nr:transposase [Candidatus Omnitrophota bacterium]
MNKYPKRKPIRLKEYNYSQPGYYYVTICTYNRNLLFGEIINNYKEPEPVLVGSQRAVTVTGSDKIPKININRYGQIAREEWENTQWLRNNVKLDEFIIMPNHIHGIIILHDTGTARCAPTGYNKGLFAGSLSVIIRSFKSAVTKRINELRQTTTPPIWQRSFYDHVIRIDSSLQNIREYIRNNPTTWAADENNLGP